MTNPPRVRWMIALALLAPVARLAADPLDEVDQSAREWVKLRVEAARLETDWRNERALVESTVEALQERAGHLEEKRDLAKARTAKDREELETLRARNRDATDDLKAGEARALALRDRLLALRPSLPPRLSEALEMSYRSLAAPELPFGERLQVAMNILNRCAQFNRQVTVGEDVLVLGGDTAKSLETLYWGLSHGYALDRRARQAWLGSPGPAGWRWEPKPDAFGQVAQLLDVARDRADPALVAIPAAATKSVAAEPVRN
jgi:hypothetical protein